MRRQFAAAGLEVREPPVRDVEVGIDKVFAAHLRDEIVVFDDLEHYLDEKLTYSRELNDAGEPTERIAEKNAFHQLDAERYVIGWLADDADTMVGIEAAFAHGRGDCRPAWMRGAGF